MPLNIATASFKDSSIKTPETKVACIIGTLFPIAFLLQIIFPIRISCKKTAPDVVLGDTSAANAMPMAE